MKVIVPGWVTHVERVEYVIEKKDTAHVIDAFYKAARQEFPDADEIELDECADWEEVE